MTHGLLYSLIFVLTISLSVFPGLSFKATFNFMNGVPNAQNWTLIMIQIIFNIFDTTGRFMGGLKSCELSISAVNTGAAVRVIFLPMFLAFALQWPPCVIVDTDWFKLTNIILMAFTNGYFCALCGIKAPETVQTEKQRASVGSYIGFCVNIGVLFGSLVASSFAPLLKQEAMS
jgi:hypothetical protein